MAFYTNITGLFKEEISNLSNFFNDFEENLEDSVDEFMYEEANWLLYAVMRHLGEQDLNWEKLKPR
ncbi:MAG: hypothetical protein V3V14_05840 [Saprospiraceae bacterium]